MMNPLPPASPVVPEPDIWIMLIKTAGMLSLVIAILIAVLYLIRRYSLHGAGLPGKNPITMIASYHLAPREKIVLLEVSGERILVGVTAQTINTLAILKKEALPETGEKEAVEKKGFKTLLSTAIKAGRKNKEGDDGRA